MVKERVDRGAGGRAGRESALAGGILQLVAQPVQTLVQSIARGSTRSLGIRKVTLASWAFLAEV